MKQLPCFCFVLWLCAAASYPAQAVMLDTDIEVETKFTSAYMWRGQVLNDEYTFQPSVTVKAHDLSFYVWGTWDMTDVTNSSERTRMDATLDLTRSMGKHIMSLGLTAFVYHDAPSHLSKDTFETYIGYALNVLFLPSLTVYFDFGEIDGLYASFALAHSFELVDNVLALDIKTTVSGGDEDFNTFSFAPTGEKLGSSLVDLTAMASFPFTLGKSGHVGITPSLKYMTLLDSELKDAVKTAGEKNDEFAYSLALTLYF